MVNKPRKQAKTQAIAIPEDAQRAPGKDPFEDAEKDISQATEVLK